jgi:hypothetical protein
MLGRVCPVKPSGGTGMAQRHPRESTGSRLVWKQPPRSQVNAHVTPRPLRRPASPTTRPPQCGRDIVAAGIAL